MIAATSLLLAFQSKSPYAGVIPLRTGKNGYEEYVAAAEILRAPAAGVYASWTPGAKPPERDRNDPDDRGPNPEIVALYTHLSKMTPLQVRREELAKYGKTLALVTQGNLKPVFDPRKGVGPETLFPEFSGFRSVAKFASRAASVYAADGQIGKAVDVLCDQLRFADNTGRGVIISNLVGTAGTAITLSAFGDLFSRLSEPDVLKVQRTVGSLLAKRPAARDSLVAELAMTSASLDIVFKQKISPKDLLEADGEGGSADEKRLMREFLNMTPASKQALRATVHRRLGVRFATMDRAFDRPEREWVDRITELSEEDSGTPHDLGGMMLSILSPVYGDYMVSVVRIRTQLRLLDLRAKLVQHRWEHGRFPASVKLTDPLTNLPYTYEAYEDGTVRLASKGIKQTGEIELRYKRQQAGNEVQKP